MYKYTTRCEEDVGITERVAPPSNPRFSAIVKERYSDFHVNEIDPGGNIVRLTCLEPPSDQTDKVALNDPEIVALIKEETIEEILSFQKKLTADYELDKYKKDKLLAKGSVEIKVTEMDKESRTKIHRWIGSFDKLSSETLDKSGGDKFIKIVAMTANLRFKRRPANRSKYTHCVLFKEGVETSDAIGFIAKKLNMKPGLISYAGIKDKRAKTTQRISVSNVEASRLIGICKYSKNIKLGNFEYNTRPIALGELKGNHFKLLLKNIKLQDSSIPIEQVVGTSVDSLKTVGFINYYGMQRFGTYEVSTWEIGKQIFNQNWMEAFDLILRPKPTDVKMPFIIKAKELWLKKRKPEEAVRMIPSRHRSVESHLLNGLARCYEKNDFVNAYLRIPRHQRLLYVHAYQSYLWNQVVSFRIKEHGLKAVEGDLVYEDPSCEVVDVGDLGLDDVAEGQSNNSEEELVPPPGLDGLVHNFQKPEVKLLTKKDVEDGKYSINDVIIPLFGSDVKYPENKTGQFLEQLLKNEGIDMECLLKFRPIGDKPSGSYRKILVLPKNVSHEIRSYSDTECLDTFIPSDWDILQKQEKPKEEESVKEKDKKCLILEFSLPSSCYATMALRELISGENENKMEQDTKRKNIKEDTQKLDQEEPSSKLFKNDDEIVFSK